MLFWPCARDLLGGSGGLSKWANKGDNCGYYMGYRGYKFGLAPKTL